MEPDQKANLRRGIAARRSSIDIVKVNLTRSSHFASDQLLPLVIQPTMEGVNLPGWAASNKELISAELEKHGAILFRGFPMDSPEKFEELARSISSELFEEYGDLPRENVGARVYGSTPYPADKAILFHNESSHQYRWPMKIWFYCVKPAERNGATPIVDCRKLYQMLDPQIIQRLTEKKLMYVRNFTNGLDVSWQQFFQTSNKALVEEYCRKTAIDFEWKSEDHLITRQICPAVVRHPYTGEMIFFNQIQLHHISFLEPAVQKAILAMFKEEDLPRNVYYGDGRPLEEPVISEITALYDRLAVRFQWQAGDVIMLDNMMVAHARDPFEGTRKILVAMAEVLSQADLK
jgi:alpha-ketoglutarate-dependent taurine dioxygenase